MDSGFGNDVGVETVAQVNRVDVVTTRYKIRSVSNSSQGSWSWSTLWIVHREQHSHRRATCVLTYHSKSLYMMVKKTCRKRLTALINTAKRKSHASPDIMPTVQKLELNLVAIRRC